MLRTYFNQRATIWDETVAEKDTTKLKLMAERLNIKSGSMVLDIGTGTGVFIPYLLGKIGNNRRLVALDFAEEMLKEAMAKGFNRNIDYVCADVTNIPLVDEIFDTIVCYSSFPHFQDKPKVLIEINRVIKNGGKLVICHTSSRTMINHIHRNIPDVENDTIPDGSKMQIMLSMAGFTDIKIDDNNDSYFCSAVKSKLR